MPGPLNYTVSTMLSLAIAFVLLSFSTGQSNFSTEKDGAAVSPPSCLSAIHKGDMIIVYWKKPADLESVVSYRILLSTGNTDREVSADRDSMFKAIINVDSSATYRVSIASFDFLFQRSKLVGPVLAVKVPGLALKGTALQNHGILTRDPSVIGEAEDGLYCSTNNATCCALPTDNGSGWYYPDGSQISTNSEQYWYTKRVTGAVVMNFRGTTSSGVTGLFHCAIRDRQNTLHSFYVGIYTEDEGHPIVTDISFILHSVRELVFNLTCTSTGGPASQVTWIQNGSNISYDSSHVLSQTVISTLDAQYNNTLTIHGRELGEYRCTVSNVRASSTSTTLRLSYVVPPGNIAATHDGTNITVSWIPSTQTSTGYMLFYQTVDDMGSVLVDDASAHQKQITNLKDDRVYTVSMVAISARLPSTETNSVIAIRPDLYIAHGSRVIPNHGLLLESDFFSNDTVQCVTARVDCCSESSDEDAAQWLNPFKLTATNDRFSQSWYGDDGHNPLGYVNLNYKKELLPSDNGLYSCVIPAPGPGFHTVSHQLLIGIYKDDKGAPVIPTPMQFTLEMLAFTLTCISTSGPATTVTWTRNGLIIMNSPTHVYRKTVNDTVTATYINTLIVTAKDPGNYQCNISNVKGSATRQLYIISPDPPAVLSAVHDSPTEIRVFWKITPALVPSLLIKYEITYFSGTDDATGNIQTVVTGVNVDSYSISNVQNSITYSIIIAAVNPYERSADIGPVVAARDPGIAHKGRILVNNSLLTLNPNAADGVGVDEDAVYCMTDDINCCGNSSSGNGRGYWYNPNEVAVESIEARYRWYATWTHGAVLLNSKHVNGAGTTGMFRCDIWDKMDIVNTFYIGVFAENEGHPRITSPIQFSLVSALSANPPKFKLTCSSTGGPATTVLWKKDGVPLLYDTTHSLTQVITSAAEANYSNTLIVTKRETGNYSCTVSNARGSDSSFIVVDAAVTPFGIRAELINSLTVKVSWSKTNTVMGAVPVRYVVYYGATGHHGNVEVPGSEQEADLTDLQINSIYNITVLALSEHLPSPSSEPSFITLADITISPSDSYLTAGQHATFTCLTRYQQINRITWKDVSGHIVNETSNSQLLQLYFYPLPPVGVYHYSCTVSLTNDTFQQNVTITVQDLQAPMLAITETSTPAAGNVYTLTCTVTVVKDLVTNPTVKWLHSDGNKVKSGTGINVGSVMISKSVSSLTLKFNPLYMSHGGQYICKATINIPEIDISNLIATKIHNISFQIPSPSLSISRHPNTPMPKVGSSFSLNCTTELDKSVDGNVIFNSSWKDYSGNIIASDSVCCQKSHSLLAKFAPLQASDSGNYTCLSIVSPLYQTEFITEGKQLISTNFSQTLAVSILDIYTPPLDVKLEKNEYRAASLLNLTCQVSDSVETLSYHWQSTCREDCFLYGSNQITSHTISRENVFNSYNVFLRSADAGTFTCVVCDARGNRGDASKEVKIVGIGAYAQENDDKHHVVINNGLVIANNGSGSGNSLRIQCVSNSTTRYSYDIGDVIANDGSVIKIGSTHGAVVVGVDDSSQIGYFSIFNDPEEHSPINSSAQGVYTCRLFDANDILQYFNFGIYPNGFEILPTITEIHFSQDKISRTLLVSCVSTGSVPTHIIWQKNGASISIDEDLTVYKTKQNITDRKASTFINTLVIHDTIDHALYQSFSCSVSNKLGLSNTSTLTVVVPGRVPSVSVRGLNAYTLQVSWTAAFAPQGIPILHYHIRISTSAEDIAMETVGSVTQSNTSKLEAGIPYNISVVAENAAGIGEAILSTNHFTQEKTPNVAPMNIAPQRINGSHMRVTWTQLTFTQARGFITHYSIQAIPTGSLYATKNKTVPGTHSAVILSDLDPQLDYCVRVWASTKAGVGKISAQACVSEELNIVIAVTSGIVAFVIPLIIILSLALPIVWICHKKKSKSTENCQQLSSNANANRIVYFQREGETEAQGEMDSDYEVMELVGVVPRCGKQDDITSHVREHCSTGGIDSVTEFMTAESGISEPYDPELALSSNTIDHHSTASVQKIAIAVSDFAAYVTEMHNDRDYGFEVDYDSIPLKAELPCNCAVIPYNNDRNRYRDIFPYDFNRVKLQELEGVEGSDYINASFVDGYSMKNQYIAAQGPMPESLNDFVRMIWEKKLPTIVMVAKCIEGGKAKCEQYWPDEIGDTMILSNGLSITLVSVIPSVEYEIRQLVIENTMEPNGSPLTVKQVAYIFWPDHGVPTNAMSLINFIRRVREVHSLQGTKPILVHCSAGVGRTGTYIVLDTVMQMMEEEGFVSILECLKNLRAQRMYAVQTLSQYVFIHDCLDEFIICGDTEIKVSNLRIKMNALECHKPEKSISGYHEQFELLEQVSCKVKGDYAKALAPHNKDKNRYSNNLPRRSSRVKLHRTPVTGSDYINASHISGYRIQDAYIATQGPLKNTVQDFWRMVWEQKCMCIIMLCRLREDHEEACYPYWPMEVDSTTTHGKLRVTLLSEQDSSDYIIRKMRLTKDKPQGAPGVALDSYIITQLQFTEWAPSSPLPSTSSLVKLIEAATKIQRKSRNGVITVMCNNGVGRTGAFICMHAQIDRLKTEGVVDFFQYVKSARIQLSGLVDNKDQYMLCHQVVADYVDSMDNYANFKELDEF